MQEIEYIQLIAMTCKEVAEEIANTTFQYRQSYFLKKKEFASIYQHKMFGKNRNKDKPQLHEKSEYAVKFK